MICNFSNNQILAGNGANVLFNISGNNIRRSSGSTTVYNLTSRLNTVEMAAVLYALGEIGA